MALVFGCVHTSYKSCDTASTMPQNTLKNRTIFFSQNQSPYLGYNNLYLNVVHWFDLMKMLFSEKMTLFVDLNFCQIVLWYACRTLEIRDASTKCYNFSIISDHPCDPKCVQLEPFKLINQPWLYGPATNL